jgi:MFS family permease
MMRHASHSWDCACFFSINCPCFWTHCQLATFVFMIFGVGTVMGQLLLGGAMGGRLYVWNRGYPPLFAGLFCLLGCFPFYLWINYVDKDTPMVWTVLISIVTGLCISGTGPIIKATLVNVTPPQSRGQAFALFNTFDDFGRGVSAFLLLHHIIA